MQRKILSLPTDRLYSIFPELMEMSIEESIEYLNQFKVEHSIYKDGQQEAHEESNYFYGKFSKYKKISIVFLVLSLIELFIILSGLLV